MGWYEYPHAKSQEHRVIAYMDRRFSTEENVCFSHVVELSVGFRRCTHALRMARFVRNLVFAGEMKPRFW